MATSKKKSTKTTKKKTRVPIPQQIITKLWAASAGRCAFHGCNKILWRDDLTMKDINQANVAHIVAAEVNGPRGDQVESPKLAKEFSNLMLMCLNCHKLIDEKDKGPASYPIELLRQWKSDHETRIERATEGTNQQKTEIVMLESKFGDRQGHIDFKRACEAITPNWYPASPTGILFDLANIATKDNSQTTWNFWETELPAQMAQKLRPDADLTSHRSVFAIAAIPLLILFGKTLGDIKPAEIYQLHRPDSTWKWPQEGSPPNFKFIRDIPSNYESREPTLVVSLSGSIPDEEIYKTVGENIAIYKIGIDTPNLSFLQSKEQLAQFVSEYREVLAIIRKNHGGNQTIHLFPAVPVAIAVEMGRRLLPKSDPQVRIYDHQRDEGGWIFTIQL
jgi:hypothetical protein